MYVTLESIRTISQRVDTKNPNTPLTDGKLLEIGELWYQEEQYTVTAN